MNKMPTLLARLQMAFDQRIEVDSNEIRLRRTRLSGTTGYRLFRYSSIINHQSSIINARPPYPHFFNPLCKRKTVLRESPVMKQISSVFLPVFRSHWA